MVSIALNPRLSYAQAEGNRDLDFPCNIFPTGAPSMIPKQKMERITHTHTIGSIKYDIAPIVSAVYASHLLLSLGRLLNARWLTSLSYWRATCWVEVRLILCAWFR